MVAVSTVVAFIAATAAVSYAAARHLCAAALRPPDGGAFAPPSRPAAEYAGYAAFLGGTVAFGLGLAALIAHLAGSPPPLWLYAAALLGTAAWSAAKAARLARGPRLPRHGIEAVALGILKACAGLAILVTVGIVFTVLGESIRFFERVPVAEFLFGLEWSPQIAIRADQAGASGSFGMVPVLAGTLLISAIAMLVAVPLGLFSAIYLSEFASARVRDVAKPTLEFLAGIPTVVYGFFALVTLSPVMRDLGGWIGVKTSGESALTAGLVIGVMTIPFVASLSEDALYAVPQDLRRGSLALGSTSGEAAIRVALPAALPGIVAGFLLALSRALGETMIVVMAAGLSARLTANPFESVTTVTVQIATLLTGDQAFDDPKTLAAFALGLLLFAFTLALNLVALGMVRRFQERYE